MKLISRERPLAGRSNPLAIFAAAFGAIQLFVDGVLVP
jgi:hypothetical protein